MRDLTVLFDLGSASARALVEAFGFPCGVYRIDGSARLLMLRGPEAGLRVWVESLVDLSADRLVAAYEGRVYGTGVPGLWSGSAAPELGVDRGLPGEVRARLLACVDAAVG